MSRIKSLATVPSAVTASIIYVLVATGVAVAVGVTVAPSDEEARPLGGLASRTAEPPAGPGPDPTVVDTTAPPTTTPPSEAPVKRTGPGDSTKSKVELVSDDRPKPIVDRRPVLPKGKGMYIWQPEKADGGKPYQIVKRAREVGLTHIFVRSGSSRSGFHGGEFLDRILPVAHEWGIQVYTWDFPYLEDIGADVARAERAMRHVAPGGHRIDGFVADIETASEGTRLTSAGAHAYSAALQARVGSKIPIIVAVPRPSSHMIGRYPYEISGYYHAIAPMVYWLNRYPHGDVTGAIDWLGRFDRPVMPIGQAYDGAPEGGRAGVPPRGEILQFMRSARDRGVSSVSFWSWQHADDEAWEAIADGPAFERADPSRKGRGSAGSQRGGSAGTRTERGI